MSYLEELYKSHCQNGEYAITREQALILLDKTSLDVLPACGSSVYVGSISTPPRGSVSIFLSRTMGKYILHTVKKFSERSKP